MGLNVLRIIKEEEKLSDRCSEINVFENLKYVTKIVNDLKDTLKANKDLFALAAPQIGVNARIFCIRFADGEIKSFVNPMITKIQNKCLMIEKDICNNKEYMIQRPDRIMVGYQSPSGKVETDVSLKNPIAAIFDYMIDVIDGTATFKHTVMGLEINRDYYKAPQEQKEELHQWYLNTYVPSKLKELQTIAENDEDIKKTTDAISFMSSVIEGKTEVVPSYNNELKFEESTLKIKEENDKRQKAFEDSLKKKFGIK